MFKCFGKQINDFINPIYHGTCYSEKIIKEGFIKVAPYGDKHISFSTKVEVAEYFARLPRDSEDNSEGKIAIFVIERPINAVDFVSQSFGDGIDLSDECEVAVIENISLKDIDYGLLIFDF
jgi:hypothetical protein